MVRTRVSLTKCFLWCLDKSYFSSGCKHFYLNSPYHLLFDLAQSTSVLGCWCFFSLKPFPALLVFKYFGNRCHLLVRGLCLPFSLESEASELNHHGFPGISRYRGSGTEDIDNSLNYLQEICCVNFQTKMMRNILLLSSLIRLAIIN